VTGVLGYQIFFMHGMKLTAAGDASLIITFNPIFTVLLAAPLLGQAISRKMFAGLFCAFIGVLIVTGWSPNTDLPFEERLLGDVLILAAALCWATTTNMTRRMMERRGGEEEATTLEIVVWYSLIGTLMLTPFAAWEAYQLGLPQPTTGDWYAILYLGALSTVLAYYWFAMGIERLGATAAASYVFIVPFFGVLGGVLLLDEKVGWSLLVGFCLIVAGVRLVQAESERLRTG
jgi:drug/metabolite transporter (DMT)-like permease